ncbi:MAG: DUF1501 domain-containing protein, partial [Nitrospirae bacterium]|nr:DUF1501 domain-containing protein [Nitrospirota bacterium]
MNTCQHCQAVKDNLSRRTFLKRVLGATGAALVMSFVPADFLRRTAAAATNAGKTLVVIFQRGGNDGLNTIIPYQDPQYYVVRPSAANAAGNIGIPPPGSANGGIAIPNSAFAMHPAIQPLFDLYNNNTLAIITQAGFANTLSHFTDQDTIERGVFSMQDGWLNRYLTAVPAGGSAALRAASIGDLADSLRGATLVPALNNLSALSFARLGNSKAPLDSNLRALYA